MMSMCSHSDSMMSIVSLDTLPHFFPSSHPTTHPHPHKRRINRKKGGGEDTDLPGICREVHCALGHEYNEQLQLPCLATNTHKMKMSYCQITRDLKAVRVCWCRLVAFYGIVLFSGD